MDVFILGDDGLYRKDAVISNVTNLWRAKWFIRFADDGSVELCIQRINGKFFAAQPYNILQDTGINATLSERFTNSVRCIGRAASFGLTLHAPIPESCFYGHPTTYSHEGYLAYPQPKRIIEIVPRRNGRDGIAIFQPSNS